MISLPIRNRMINAILTDPTSPAKHLYQIMVNELKIPHVAVSSIYMMVQAAVIVGYLVFAEWGYFYLLGIVVLLSIIYVLFMKRYFCLC